MSPVKHVTHVPDHTGVSVAGSASDRDAYAGRVRDWALGRVLQRNVSAVPARLTHRYAASVRPHTSGPSPFRPKRLGRRLPAALRPEALSQRGEEAFVARASRRLHRRAPSRTPRIG